MDQEGTPEITKDDRESKLVSNLILNVQSAMPVIPLLSTSFNTRARAQRERERERE